jgi:apolipoprotein N-acyltransferase
MTALRGVENGYAIARSARQGLMTVSDRYGRILAERASEPEVTTLVARLPAASDEAPTIFARYGGLTDWLWVGFAALLLWRLRRSGSNLPADRK